MTLKDYRESFEYFSSKSSDVSRQLSFSGIAIIWLLQSKVTESLKGELLDSLGLFVVSLSMDLLHYAIASVIWGIFCACKEKAGIKDIDETSANVLLTLPQKILYAIKLIATAMGYWGIAQYMKLV